MSRKGCSKGGSGLCPWGCGAAVLFRRNKDTGERLVLEPGAEVVGVDQWGNERTVNPYHRCVGDEEAQVSPAWAEQQFYVVLDEATLTLEEKAVVISRVLQVAGVARWADVPPGQLMQRARQIGTFLDKYGRGGVKQLVARWAAEQQQQEEGATP